MSDTTTATTAVTNTCVSCMKSCLAAHPRISLFLIVVGIVAVCIIIIDVVDKLVGREGFVEMDSQPAPVNASVPTLGSKYQVVGNIGPTLVTADLNLGAAVAAPSVVPLDFSKPIVDVSDIGDLEYRLPFDDGTQGVTGGAILDLTPVADSLPYVVHDSNPPWGSLPAFTNFENNICSPSCCGPQYPLPFPTPKDDRVCNSGKTYVPNNYTCMDGTRSGCYCMTKEEAEFLETRGGNAV